MSTKSTLTAGLLCALACWLAFPNPAGQMPLLVMLFPGILSIMALQLRSPRRVFLFGLLSGMAGYGACLYWLAVPVHDYGYMPWLIAMPFPLLLGTYIALYSGLFGLALHLYTYRFLVAAGSQFSFSDLRTCDLLKLGILAGILWALLEYLRGCLFTGFPWLTLSSAFMAWPWAIQGLSALGVYALSGLYAGIAVCLGLGIAFFYHKERGKSILPAILPFAFTLAALIFLSVWTWFSFSPKAVFSKALRVVLVQGNINQDQKWNQEYQESTLEHYAHLTVQALNQLSSLCCLCTVRSAHQAGRLAGNSNAVFLQPQWQAG